MAPHEIILVGGGGHCRSCIDVIESVEGLSVCGIVDRDPALADAHVLGYPVIGNDEDLPSLLEPPRHCLVTVGQIDTGEPRARLYRHLKQLAAPLATVRSRHAVVSSHASLGEGTIVMHRAVVNAGAVVGANTILNTGCVVEHDVHIGDHCHISTGSIVNGTCRIGNHVFVGSGAVVRQEVAVADGVIIGAGAVVVSDITESGTYLGVPARRQGDPSS